MTACPACIDWRIAFALTSQRTIEGAIVAMRFEQWLLFHLHVAVHQAGRWPGEFAPAIDQSQESV